MNELVPIFVAAVVLAGMAAIMIAYRRRRGRIEVKYGEASVAYMSRPARRRAARGLVIEESDVSGSTIDLVRGADAAIDSSRVKDSTVVIREPEPPGRRPAPVRDEAV